MSYTNLLLGHNWEGEWPEYVSVSHEGEGDEKPYVPKRTCIVEAMCFDEDTGKYECYLSCGDDFEWYDREAPDYCPWCGARIEKSDD